MTKVVDFKIEKIYGRDGADIAALEGYTHLEYDPSLPQRFALKPMVVGAKDVGPSLTPYVLDQRQQYYDHFPQITSWQQLLQYYPDLYVDRTYGWENPAVQDGDQVLFLEGILVRDSSPAFIHTVYDLAGMPWEGVRVAISWPDAPPADPPETFRPPYGFPGQPNRGAAGWTNAEGVIGFGWSADGGYSHVFRTWPMTPAPPVDPKQVPAYSDALINYGAMGGTNRNTVTGIWRVYRYVEENGGTPPTQPPGDGYRLEIVIGGQTAGYVAISPTVSGDDVIYIIDPDNNRVGGIQISPV